MSDNAYAPPKSHVADTGASAEAFEYVGFWARVGASLLDTVFQMLFTIPLLWAVYGRASYDAPAPHFFRGSAEIFISYVLPALAVIGFWIARQATPGKMLIGAKIVDAKTGGPMSVGQSIGRYLAYFPSGMLLGLGIFWVAFDARKQGWHDKLAGTLVVKVRP